MTMTKFAKYLILFFKIVLTIAKFAKFSRNVRFARFFTKVQKLAHSHEN
jgi:hypothetical protein